ncbi:DUF362 domain-containing protein [Thermodesulfobacteriota bacterium]
MRDKRSGRPFEWLSRSLDRREFLKYQVKGALFLVAGSSGLIVPGTGLAAGVPDIAVVKGPPGSATRAAVELMGGMGSFVKQGNRVVIKPNMSFPNPPEMASTTHPEVIRELSVMCKEAGASRILIADYPLSLTRDCLKRTGIRDACKDIDDTTVVGASSGRLYLETDFPGAEIMPENGVLKEVLKADVLIAAPVAKSHTATGVSLSMKGMMGLVWDRQSMHTLGLASSIVDMCAILKADLTVIDGTRVLSTRGPRGPGKVLKEDTVIVSKDMVAADAYAVSLFSWYGRKYKPRQVQHIRQAHKRGLGRMDIENLNVKKLVL